GHRAGVEAKCALASDGRRHLAASRHLARADRCVCAAGGRITCVRSADVIVVAVHRRSAYACSPDAVIAGGAGVVVSAGSGIRRMYATERRVASIVGARVIVVAIGRRAAGALALAASLAGGGGA